MIGKLFKDDFFRAGTFLMGMSLAGGVINVVFRMVVGRLLTSEDYGVMDAMFQGMGIVGIPFAAIQLALTQYVARYIAEGRPDLAGQVLRRATRRLLIYGVVILVVGAAGANAIRAALRLDSNWPIWITGVTMLVSVVGGVYSAGLQGEQRFITMGSVGFISAIVRVVVAWALVAMGAGASGALSGTLATSLFTTGVGLWLLWPILQKGAGAVLDSGPIYRYLWPTMLAIGVSSLMTGADMLVVKHFFEPEMAGDYARATAIGRLVFFLNGSVMMILFPKVAAESASGKSTLYLLWKAIAFGLAVCMAGTLFCTFWPSLPIRVLHGSQYLFIAPWVTGFAWAMLPVSLFAFVMQYLMGAKNFRFLFVLTPAIVTYFGALLIWHKTIPMVIGVVAGGGILCLAVCLVAVMTGERRRCRCDE